MADLSLLDCPSRAGWEGSWSGAEPAWFCIRSQPKHEHIAAAHLRQTPAVKVFNPQLRLLRSTRRGRVWFTESLFPNYLFARFVLPALLERIRYTPGVKAVVQFGGRVPAIPDAVIEELQQSLLANGSTIFTDAPVEGEEVEVTAGPFQGGRGPVTRVLPGKQRVQVLLEVMGRSVPAELSLDAILFKRRDATQVVLEVRGTAGRSRAWVAAQAGTTERRQTHGAVAANFGIANSK